MWNQVGKSTSLPTISRPTKPRPSKLFPSEHSRVHLQFTPTYSSWLNQVEIWFSKIQRDVIARASSNPRQISPGKSCVTSATTTKRRSLSDGATKIPPTEYDELFTFICYAALEGDRCKPVVEGDCAMLLEETTACGRRRTLQSSKLKRKTDIIRYSP